MFLQATQRIAGLPPGKFVVLEEVRRPACTCCAIILHDKTVIHRLAADSGGSVDAGRRWRGARTQQLRLFQ